MWEGVECNKSIYILLLFIIYYIGKCPYGPDPDIDYLKVSDDKDQSYTLVTIKFDITDDKKIFRLVYRNRIASDNINFTNTAPSIYILLLIVN